MYQPEIEGWKLRIRTPADYVGILTRNTYWIPAIFVFVLSVGILSISEWAKSPAGTSILNVESQSFIPTAMPTAFPTMVPTAFPTMMPTEAPPERIKPTGPPQPVPLPPRPANLSLVGIGFTVFFSMLAVIAVILIDLRKKGFQFLTKRTYR